MQVELGKSYRIAAKRVNVSLDPLQCQQLILYAKIAIDSSLPDCQEPQWPLAIVDVDLDHVLSGVATRVHCIRDAARFVAATIDPDLDGQLGLVGFVHRNPDVKEEAVDIVRERRRAICVEQAVVIRTSPRTVSPSR